MNEKPTLYRIRQVLDELDVGMLDEFEALAMIVKILKEVYRGN